MQIKYLVFSPHQAQNYLPKIIVKSDEDRAHWSQVKNEKEKKEKNIGSTSIVHGLLVISQQKNCLEAHHFLDEFW